MFNLFETIDADGLVVLVITYGVIAVLLYIAMSLRRLSFIRPHRRKDFDDHRRETLDFIERGHGKRVDFQTQFQLSGYSSAGDTCPD